jgi:predicted  nucleic acid-binding Zn-ribbon protein
MAAGSGNPDDGTQRSLTDYAGNNPKTPDNTGIDETMTAEDIKKLEDQIKALSDQNATIMKALEAQTAPPKKEEKSDEIKALEAALVAKDVEIRAASEAQAALDARIKALEQDGTTKTGGNQPAELSEPMNAGVSIDRKTGTIRRV